MRSVLSDIGKLLISSGVLAAVAVTQASGKQVSGGYQPPEYHDGQTHREKAEQHVGRFNIVRYIEDCRAVPMLDFGCWLTKEAQLSWRDSTGKIGFTFTDNGYGIRFKPEGTDGRTVCLMQEVLVEYDPKPSTAANWQNLQPFIASEIGACSAIARADLQRMLSELQVSGADYVAAAGAWKAVSLELFGPGGKRCVREKMAKPVTMPPRFECVAYSQP